MKRIVVASLVLASCSSDDDLPVAELTKEGTRLGSSIRLADGSTPAGVIATDEYTPRRSIGFLFDLGRLSSAGLALVDRADVAPRDGFISIEELISVERREDRDALQVAWRWMRAPRLLTVLPPGTVPAPPIRAMRYPGTPYVDDSTPKTMHAFALDVPVDGPENAVTIDVPLSPSLALRVTRTVECLDARVGELIADAGTRMRVTANPQLSMEDRFELFSPSGGRVVLSADAGEQVVSSIEPNLGSYETYEVWTDEPVERVRLGSWVMPRRTSSPLPLGFRLRAFDRDLDLLFTDDGHGRPSSATFRWTAVPRPSDHPVADDDPLFDERFDTTEPGHYETHIEPEGAIAVDVYPEGAVFLKLAGKPERQLEPNGARLRGDYDAWVGEGSLGLRRGKDPIVYVPLDRSTRKAW